MTVSDDRKVVQCNLTETTNIAPKGARAYLVEANRGNGHDRIMILLRSHGGRWICKYESMGRLDNFRVKTIPPEHPLYDDERIHSYNPAALAAELLEAKQRMSDTP